MGYCDLLDSCYFYKNELSGMPCTYKHMMNKYCYGDYSKCTRLAYARSYGRNNVPLDMFPNDFFENLNITLPKVSQPQGGINADKGNFF
jgi:hypothetical protein